MIDLHSHILPGIDDGAADLSVSLDMARAFVDDGVQVLAATPHILPGVYHNTGPQIRNHVAALQSSLREHGIALQLVPGADNHMVQDFAGQLRAGHLLTLADTRYALVEPPHNIAPPRLKEFFFDIQVAGFVPILTHPERLRWLGDHFATVREMARAGVWMQITCGSVTGKFGKRPQFWAEKMLDEGLVHILASDAHDTERRPPAMTEAYHKAISFVGEDEAVNLVLTRPQQVLADAPPSDVAPPVGLGLRQSSRAPSSPGKGARGEKPTGLVATMKRMFGAN